MNTQINSIMEKNFKDLIISRHELLSVLGKGEKKWWEIGKPAVKHSFTWKISTEHQALFRPQKPKRNSNVFSSKFLTDHIKP